MKIIGLTGGIASGKSTVSNYLASKGIKIIDADKISRSIYDIGSKAYVSVVKEFGVEILNDDKTINRRKLGNIVFADKERLNILNKITHPIIFDEIKRQIMELTIQGSSICVLDAALLIESGWYKVTDLKWLVYVNRETQIKRLIERDKISKEEAINRIKAQMPFEEKVKYADFIIDNNSSIRYTYEQVDILLNIALNGGKK